MGDYLKTKFGPSGIHHSCGFGHFLIHHGTAPPRDTHYDKTFGLTNQKPSFNIYEARNDVYVNVDNELENNFENLFDDVIQKNLETRFYHCNFSLPKLIEAAILGNNPKVPNIKASTLKCHLETFFYEHLEIAIFYLDIAGNEDVSEWHLSQ